jgi:hypothetical protein
MKNIISMNAKHPLVGVWRPPDGDESAEYTIRAAGGGFQVSGVDRYDGENFVISDVSWDGEVLRFTSTMPSTSWELQHEFRVLDGSVVEHTYIRREVWSRSPDE